MIRLQVPAASQTSEEIVRERSVLNFEIVKHLFAERPTIDDSPSHFRVNGGPEPVVISIPSLVMYRLYRLGQAYDLHWLKFLESNVQLIVGTTQLPEIIKELEQVVELVNDPLIHKYAGALLAGISIGPGPSAKHVAIATGEFKPRRGNAHLNIR